MDLRGSGMSSASTLDFERFDEDIDAVAAAWGLESFSLLVASVGAIRGILYAVDHPLHRLILWNGVASYDDPAMRPGGRRASVQLGLEEGWPFWVETIGATLAGVNQPAGVRESVMALMTRSLTDDNSKHLFANLIHESAAAALPHVDVPTLLLCRRECEPYPVAFGQRLAAGIPDSRLVVLDGNCAFMFGDDPSAVSSAITRFLDEENGAPSSTAFRAILFTDVVASTPLLAQLKDAKMREVMRDHDAILQAAVDEHGGRVVKEIGDAFMAEFAVPSAAVECAIAMQRGIQAQFADTDVPIRLRIGINAGEPVEEDGDLHGASVVVAKRLESEANTNGILVSDVVKSAVLGKDFAFEDRGEVTLKGFDEPVRAWSVEWA